MDRKAKDMAGKAARFLSWKLSTKLMIAILAIGLIPLLVGAGYSYFNTQGFLVSSSEHDLDRQTHTVADKLERAFEQMSSDLLLAAQNPAFIMYYTNPEERGHWRKEVNKQIKGVSEVFPGAVDEMCFIDASGRELSRVVKGKLAPVSELSSDESAAPFFKPAMAMGKGGVYISKPYLSADSGRWVVSATTPIIKPNGKRAAILHYEFNVDYFRKLLAGDFVKGQRAMVLDDKKKLVIPSHRRPIADERMDEYKTDQPDFLGALKKVYAGNSGIITFRPVTKGKVGKHHMISWVTLRNQPGDENRWKIAAIYEPDTLPLSGGRAKAFVLVAIATMAVLVVLALLAGRYVTGPINAVLERTRGIAEGDLEKELSINRTDEFGALADSVNAMSSQLKEAFDREALSKARLQEQVGQLTDVVHATASGDLSLTAPSFDDADSQEMTALSHDINLMIENFRNITAKMRETSGTLETLGGEILKGSEEQASGATEQAAAVVETTATIEELAATAKQVAENAEVVTTVAEQALSDAREGEAVSEVSTQAIFDVQETTKATADKILILGERSQQIGAVLQIINDVAEQTNLLAFNAAIEAARAGEAGKGFSIVASEIRRLAEDVKTSTKEISDIISEIQGAINSSVLATEEAIKKTEKGVELAKRSGDAFRKILDMAEETTQSAQQISVATQQQRSASEQIAATMREISQVTRHSANNSKQSTEAACRLAVASQELRHLVDLFKVEGEEETFAAADLDSMTNLTETGIGGTNGGSKK